MKEKERNVALIDKAYKLTRSEYLENKTELSDEDIVRILDLPAEKEIRTQIKSYTDKDYLELAKDNTKLSQLTESLKNDAEYLTYRGSYIAKSKLLYESPVTLCNEIPSLLIGEEIGESFYLLPYGYAKDKSENFKKFADMLERDNFIDIKRNYSTKLKHNFKKGHNQGNNIFFFITSDKTDYEKIRQEINKCVYNRKEVQNKTAKYIVYIEQSNRCGSFSFDTTGKLVTEKEYTLKQIRSFDNERPLVARGRMQSIPSGTSLILNNNDENVNDLFHSLLLRGELEMIRVHPELHIYSDKYKEACSTLGKITNETHSKLLKSSNLAFLQSEKQTQFYKDLQIGSVDNDKAPLFAAIKPNGKGTYNFEQIDSNFMLSVYGKDNGFSEYIERAIKENKILYWNKEKSQELFMFQGLQLPEAFNNLDPNKILHQTNSAVNNKSRLQGEKTMAPEKQIIAEIGFADGEIKQYEDSKEFLDDLNAASKENAYDTSFRVYAESDKLKQKAADVKLDNYDPMEAAERIHNGYEWNDVEHEAVQFTQSAEGRRLLKDAENGRLTMLDARGILDAVEKNGMTLRYDPLPNSYVVDGWTAADGEKLDNYVVSMSELKRLAGIEISENSQQNQIQEKKTARTPEEEQAYQEWLEMLDDNQQAEDRMERMQGVPSEEQKPLPKWQQRLNTLLAATEDVSRDEQIIQAVNGSASLFIPDEREYKSYQNQLDEYLAGKLKPSDFISLGKTPAVLEKIGVNQNEVVIFQNVIDKALRQPQTDENGKFVQGHEIDVSVLEKLPEYISNPLMVFKSDTVPNSKVIMTEYQDVNDRTVVIALHCDSRADSGKLIVNRISSVYRKDNDYFFLNQIKKGNLEYIDEKRSQEWAVRQRLQLPPLTDILGYNQNITTKEDFVNSQKSLSKKRNVEHEEAPTQGDKSMPGEKKELSFSEQVDLVLAGKYNRFDALKVCDTPDLLLQSGLKQLPMLYTQRHLREAIQQKDLHNHTHGIKIEQIKSLPELIKNPVMIYDSLSRSDSLLVLTSEIDVDKMPIVVSIRPNGKGTYELKKVDSNFITSMYGRENFEQHINSVINNGKIIYWNKEKSQALFSVLGQRLPKGLNNLDPYKILHQTNSVVNTQFQTRTTEQETPTIKNNNEKSQESHSDAKDYLIQTTRLFLSKLKEKNLPFLRGKERGPNIIIRPQAARDAATGKAFTGYTQLMAQALIQALYDQKKLPELEYDLITYDQAKACGTFIKKGSPHITLTNYNRTTNSASKQMYYFKSGCNSPEMIDLHKESIARNRAIKRIRLSLENKEIPSERQTEEKNKITLLHYEEMTYLKALNKDTEQYFDSLTAEEKEMLKTLCSKEPLTQKTVKELAETLRKDRLISAQLSSQKNSGRSFDATECIVPEDFIGKAMAAASLGCSLETTQGTIDRITKDLHQTLSRNLEHYDYGKPFETGEIINGKCRNNVKDMCNKEYEAEELAKKIEQQQMALKKNPINALMELLNRNDLSDRTIGGYER